MFAEEARSELLTPDATAFTDSVTTMVTTSSTWLARRSRPSSFRRPAGDQMAPGNDSSFSALAAALLRYSSSSVVGGAFVDFVFLVVSAARAGGMVTTTAMNPN